MDRSINMASTFTRKIFWSCVAIGIIFNFIVDIKVYRESSLPYKSSIQLASTYEVLNEIDAFTILLLKQTNFESQKPQLLEKLKTLKLHLSQDIFQRAHLDSIKASLSEVTRPNEFPLKSQKILSLLSDLRQISEKILTEKILSRDKENKAVIHRSMVAIGLDLGTILLLGLFFGFELWVRRKGEKSLRETIFNLQRTNNTLAQSDFSKANLFKTTVHDLKNPLGSIKNFADLIHDEPTNPKSVVELIEFIQRISARTLNQVNSLLEPTALGSGQAVLNSKEINVVDSLHELCQFFQPAALAKNQKINLIAFEKSVCIKGDPEKLADVFSNLIGNAIKFSPHGTPITVTCRKIVNQIEIRIEDKGPGFSEKDISMAFQPGQTLTARPTGGETSSGIGLYSAKQIIELHSGSIQITTNSSGQGACVIVQIPVLAAHAFDTATL